MSVQTFDSTLILGQSSGCGPAHARPLRHRSSRLRKGTEFTPERSTITVTHELLTIGRISVDIYPNDIGVDLEDVTSFGKYLGGSPVQRCRRRRPPRPPHRRYHPHRRRRLRHLPAPRTAQVQRGRFLRHRRSRNGPPPSPSARSSRPEDFPLYFYGRFPTAPDLQIKAEELDLDAIRDAGIFWSTVTGLCQEPSRSAHLAAHEARPRTGLKPGQFTILDLDYRPMFWASEEEARAAGRQDPPARHRRHRQRQGMRRRRRRGHPG